MSEAAYIATLHEENGVIGVSFPDFPGCVTTAGDMSSAIERGAQALGLHVEGMIEDGEALPEPRSVERLIAEERNGSRMLSSLSSRSKSPAKRCASTSRSTKPCWRALTKRRRAPGRPAPGSSPARRASGSRRWDSRVRRAAADRQTSTSAGQVSRLSRTSLRPEFRVRRQLHRPRAAIPASPPRAVPSPCSPGRPRRARTASCQSPSRMTVFRLGVSLTRAQSVCADGSLSPASCWSGFPAGCSI